MLHCGLHAVNALLASDKRIRPATAAELDRINHRLHDLERAVHAEGEDLRPDARGNYPVEVLMQCLGRRGLSTQFVRHPNTARIHRRTVGFLLATGDHYVAVVRERTTSGDGWGLYDNGVRTTEGASWRDLVSTWGGGTVRAVLSVNAA